MSQGCAGQSPQEGFSRFGELSEKFDTVVTRVRAIDQPVKSFRYFTRFLQDATPPRFEVEEFVEETQPADVRSAFKPQPNEGFAPLALQSVLGLPPLNLDPKDLDDLVKLKAEVARVVGVFELTGISTMKGAAELQKCADNVQQALDCVLQLEKLLTPRESMLEQKQQEVQDLNKRLQTYCQPGDVVFQQPFCAGSLCLANVPLAAKNALAEWVKGRAVRLLWRASRDGRTPAAFHAKCDNQGATLTLIRSTGGFVFGGFTAVAWQSASAWVQDDQAWLFTLTNPSGRAPLNFKVRDHSKAIYTDISYLPSFGPGHDLHLNASPGSSYTNPPHGYTDATGLGNALFTGSRNFDFDEAEVFAVDASAVAAA